MIIQDPENLPLAVGSRIRIHRTGQGLTLNDLALLTGISAPALSLIETGKRDPRLTTLARIAEAIRTPIASLFEPGDEEETTESPSPGHGYDLGEYL